MSDVIDPQVVTLRAVLKDLEHLVIVPNRLTIVNSFQAGYGGYGEVVLAKLDESDPSAGEVAVKQLRTVGTNGVRIRVALRLARELKIWAKVEHPNILGLIGYYLSENYEIAQLVSPFMANGNVLRYIAERQPNMEQRLGFVSSSTIKGQSRAYTPSIFPKNVIDITVGMEYLHNCDPPICHGDLKPANVLINDPPFAVLCDFGLASIAGEAGASSGLTTSRSLKGSTRYMSPELLMGTETKPTLASDVWAWACTGFQILTDIEPYPNAILDWAVIAAIIQNEPPGDLKTFGNNPVLALNPISNHLRRCWCFEPADRPLMVDSLLVIKKAKFFATISAPPSNTSHYTANEGEYESE